MIFARFAMYSPMSTENWKEFNFSSYREIPDSPGVYCWRYRPKIERGQIAKLHSLLAQEEDIIKRAKILHESIEGQLLRPFSRPDYFVTLQGPLLPKFAGKAAHAIPDFSDRFLSLAKDLDSLPQFIDYINKLYDMISMPFYIGIASDQTLNSRIKSHVLAIIRYKQEGRFGDISDEESINLASRIVERHINPTFLWISCLALKSARDCELNLSDLEFVLNRTVHPVLGKN
jgi:hypothetical protein